MIADLVGHRVVLRRTAGERHGRTVYSDVLGILVSADDEVLAIRRHDGTTVTVPAGEVHRLKAVPPRTADVLTIERAAAAGWPAPDTTRLGDWLLRAASGWTRRANSVLALGTPGRPLDDALAFVHDWYTERGLPVSFHIATPVALPLDEKLGARGWRLEIPVHILTGPLPETTADPRVHLDPEPSEGWRTLYRGHGPLPEVAGPILTGPPLATFASLHDTDRIVAIGRADVQGDWAGISAVEVLPEYRRRGLARRIMQALFHWAARQGATRCYLQVDAANTPALALYAKLGFLRHHGYHYRVPG